MGSDDFLALLIAGKAGKRLVEPVGRDEQFLGLAGIDLQHEVELTDGLQVGELDEEMVFESRVGETFLLGASTWRIEEITHDRVLVTPAPGAPGKMPFWRGERAGRPLEFGRAIGALTRELSSLPADQAEEMKDASADNVRRPISTTSGRMDFAGSP